MTADDMRPELLAARTSVALSAVIEKIKSKQAANATEVETLRAQRARYRMSGNTASVQHTSDRIAALTLNGECLQEQCDDAASRVPVLEMAERQATERLRSEYATVNEEIISHQATVLKEWDTIAAAVARLALAEHNLDQRRRGFYRDLIMAPELARAAVPPTLVSAPIFASGQGVSTIRECIHILPATLAPTDAPNASRPRWWPPLPPTFPKAPPAPVRERLPYVKSGRTVEFEYRHPAGPFEPDEDDLMPFRATPAAS